MSRRDYKKSKRGSAPFVQLRHGLLNTEAWRSLSTGARALYIELRKQYRGHNNGNLFLSHRDAAEALGTHRNTVGKWFKELRDRGFIALTKGHHLGPSGCGVADRYRLTDEATPDGRGGTHDFRKWKTPAQN